MKQAKQLKGSLMLLLAAFIWGSTFVAQDKAATEPFTFIACRMILGAVVLIPVIIVFDIVAKKKSVASTDFRIMSFTKTEFIGGTVCGCILFMAASLQQYGIYFYPSEEAAAGKSGFITALYIVLVPIAGLFMRKKSGFIIWVSVAIATVGMYLLCVKKGFVIQTADLILLVCAVGYTAHILVIDHFSPKVNGIKLSALQFFVCGVLGIIFMFIFEEPTISGIKGDIIPILYAGLLSSGVAYTFQVVAQKHTKPAVASVLMSLESVFAVVTGMLFGEHMSGREIIGCVLMFAAVLLAQIDPAAFKKQQIK